MRFGALWTLLPDEAIPIVILALILAAVFLGRRVLPILVVVVLSVVLAPFVSSFVDTLPTPIVIALGIAFMLVVVRSVAVLILGAGAADHMTGVLAADAIRFAVRSAVFLPSMLMRLAFRGPRLGIRRNRRSEE